MPSHLAPGTKVSRYEIVIHLGSGAMGQVYLAHDIELDRKVALKVLPAEMLKDSDRIRRFTREAKAAAALNHPNIAHVYETGKSNSISFIALEFVDGRTLREELGLGPIKISDVLEIGCQIASALTAAHASGIVHRDLKPENVMRTRDGSIKVVDFGLAKLQESAEIELDREATTRSMSLTEPGVVLGTVAYMSPEQVRALSIDARTDLFSLGIVLYEMISGTPPFGGLTRSDVIAAILEREAAPLSRFVTEVSAQLEFIILKALRKDREERYQTAKDLLTDLKLLRRKLEFETELQRNPQKVQPVQNVNLPFPSDDRQGKNIPTRQPEHIRSIMESFLERIQEMDGRAAILTGLSTGYNYLDQITAGFQAGQLITVVGPPRVGASTLCVNFARNVALRNKTGVLFFSLERSRDDILCRIICAHCGIQLTRLRTGFLSRSEWALIAKALSEIGDTRILIDDSSDLSLTEIKKRVFTACQNERIQLVIIDYLQLVSDLWPEVQPDTKAYAQTARNLKALTLEHNLAVLIICRASAAFTLNSISEDPLRELPEYPLIRMIEEASDVVMVASPYERHGERANTVSLAVTKNRNGTTGVIVLNYQKELALFEGAEILFEEDAK